MFDHDYHATATLEAPATHDAPRKQAASDRSLTVLGVNITDVTKPRALELLEELILQYDGRTRSVFFVNAHTLNLAAADEQYRAALDSADCVFGDGTGVRWASRLHGHRVKDNLNGTDLIPEFLHAAAGRGYRYFLLGADDQTIRRAAGYADETFWGWTPAGFHHGYLTDPEMTAELIHRINRARPHLLLVGMGNPVQEQWIHRHRHELQVPLCIAVGGLFDFWGENFSRAPRWLRNLGHEWIWRLLQQPGNKARRYLIGNPLFLARILREQWQIRRRRRGDIVHLAARPNRQAG
ncbi:MAG TPA: WecB/TagA/CpsF family glycosyltransferase [Thermoguttaceae bacterium]|nr:WecB/TagA/CpsF family glycosyltransferase [Thermoguttaceae bacterium]